MKYVVLDSNEIMDSIWTKKSDAIKRKNIIDGYIVPVCFDDFELLND